MRRNIFPPAAVVFLALSLALSLSSPALAVEPSLTLPDTVAPVAKPAQQPQTAPSTLPPIEEKNALPLQANAPIHMDQALAREHERFSQFAIGQMHKMNANIIGGKHSMQVHKHGPKKYRASYKAIDVEGIVCQVRRSSSNPNYYVGSVLYKEHILESVAEAPESCRKGTFVRVSETPNRIIYSSKHGGGWQ
ncbi:MAG: hypothetical protein Q8S17_05040 [Humidesulfovibrio sp.]|nr:hypothetical protein [Humidesulfovibrio sp.]